MKYTKGKWEVVQDTLYPVQIEVISNAKYDGNQDAMIGEKQICMVTSEYDEQRYSTDEQEANAKLISKAPEMYEALKELYEESVITSGLTVARIVTTPDLIIKLESLLNEIES